MNILALLLFATIAPVAALYSLEYSRNGGLQAVEIKAMFSPKRKESLATYIFFAAAAVGLFFFGSGDMLTLSGDCLVIMFGYAAALTDLSTRKVPNMLVLAIFGIWAALALARIVISFESGMQSLIASGIGFLIGGGLMLIVYLASRKGLGAGDVKFMGAAGLYLSSRWILAVMLIGGVLCLLFALALMLMKKLKMSDSLPLIPFLCAGIILTVFFR